MSFVVFLHLRDSCLETGMVKIPPKNINPNSYSVQKIFVLKIKKDGSTNNKVIAWKPCCHQTDTNHDDRPRTAKCLRSYKSPWN